jgi:hypothetical protein
LHVCAAYPISPLSCLRVFGWLLHDKISNGGHLRPSLYFIFVIFCRLIRRPEIRKTFPLYTPPLPHILFIIPPIAATNYLLIVVSYDQTVAA